MRYEIDSKNAIRVYDDGQDVPFAYQPDWPDATPWASKKEAKAWAELLIVSMQNLESEFLPGASPSNHPKLRPEPDTLEESEPAA
jgi:hypothetical protein